MAGLETSAAAVLSFAVWTVLQATVLLAGALLGSSLLRRSSANSRHALWTVALAGLLILPLLSLAIPSISVRIPGSALAEPALKWSALLVRPAGESARLDMERASVSGWAESISRTGQVSPDSEATQPPGSSATHLEIGAIPGAVTESATTPPIHSLPSVLLLAWLTGAALWSLRLGVALRRVSVVCRDAVVASDREWAAPLRDACVKSEFSRPVSLRLTGHVRTALAGGLRRAVILLPESAREWSEERRNLVLIHEVVHLKRLDPQRQILGQLVLSLYWFHPLAWYALRSANSAREEACDEAVVARSHCRPSTYARHLLALATPDPLPLPALSGNHGDVLEKRLMKILNPSPRGMGTPAVATGVGLVLVLSAAAVAPASTAEITVDATEASLAAVISDPPMPLSPEIPPPGASAFPALADETRPPLAPSPPQPVLPAVTRDPGQACRPSDDGINFEDGRDFVGPRTSDRGWFQQISLEELMLCARASGAFNMDPDRFAEEGLADGSWVVLAIRGAGALQRMEITAANGELEHAWIINGEPRPFDELAREWRDAVLTVVNTPAAVARARGDEARLRGEMARIRAAEARVRAQVAAIQSEQARRVAVLARARGEAAAVSASDLRARAAGSALETAVNAIAIAERTELDEEARQDLREMAFRLVEISQRERAREPGGRETEQRAELQTRIVEMERTLEEARRQANARQAELLDEIQRMDTSAHIERLENQIREIDTPGGIREIEVAAELARARLRELVEELR